MIGIDFTNSNKNPNSSSSLHYISESNQYINTMKSLGEILINYNPIKLTPVYGFGNFNGFNIFF